MNEQRMTMLLERLNAADQAVKASPTLGYDGFRIDYALDAIRGVLLALIDEVRQLGADQ